MGTNYYWIPSIKDPEWAAIFGARAFAEVFAGVHDRDMMWIDAPEDDWIHIGKSSSGWVFSLHVYETIPDLNFWYYVWTNERGHITDEYGYVEHIDPDELLSTVILNRPDCARHPLDLKFCIEHGAGSYDLCIGKFT